MAVIKPEEDIAAEEELQVRFPGLDAGEEAQPLAMSNPIFIAGE